MKKRSQFPQDEENLGVVLAVDGLHSTRIPAGTWGILVQDPDGNSNNHPVRVRISPTVKNDAQPTPYPEGELLEVHVSQGQARIMPIQEPEPGRGVRIEITFWNEHSGDFWATEYRFHKGDTYVRTFVPDLSPEERKRLASATLWRD